ncbi:unnamed protein product [Boreogadus saida]
MSVPILIRPLRDAPHLSRPGPARERIGAGQRPSTLRLQATGKNPWVLSLDLLSPHMHKELYGRWDVSLCAS